MEAPDPWTDRNWKEKAERLEREINVLRESLLAAAVELNTKVQCHHEELEDNGTGDLRCKVCKFSPHSMDWWCRHRQNSLVKELREVNSTSAARIEVLEKGMERWKGEL